MHIKSKFEGAEAPAKSESSSPTLGIVGGGQLARMTAMAALRLGCKVAVLERSGQNLTPASASLTIEGDWRKIEDLRRLAAVSDVMTLENEFVDAGLLEQLEAEGHCIRPGARSLGLVQDKFVQKQTVAAAGVAVPQFRAVSTPGEVVEAAKAFGWPLLLKTRRNGYDGKGNATVRGPEEVESAWNKLGGPNNSLYVEAFCSFQAEVAVIITRGVNGETVSYPLVETVQRNHVCNEVLAPARVSPAVRERALSMARTAIEAVGAVGSFGVEMFLQSNGEVLLNELAPRVHNTGHYTIEACACSQFENHVRAVLGWPLGSTEMIVPAAVMLNLLGTVQAPGMPRGMDRALRAPKAHVHIYGKATASPGRKMGHVTALGSTLEEASALAQAAAREIHFA